MAAAIRGFRFDSTAGYSLVTIDRGTVHVGLMTMVFPSHPTKIPGSASDSVRATQNGYRVFRKLPGCRYTIPQPPVNSGIINQNVGAPRSLFSQRSRSRGPTMTIADGFVEVLVEVRRP